MTRPLALDTVVAEMRRRARAVRERLAPPPVVVARDTVPRGRGEVVTVAYADHRSPSGKRYQTTARWPSGRVAERKWTTYTVDAMAAHSAVVARQTRRILPEQ